MATIELYVPVYMEGANGKKAYQFAKVSGVTVSNATVPEGELCIKSSATTSTPPVSQQPPSS
tara:strand:- start:1752 stop:1937 length:186 start_codon:yes stop_codon:yes gene_type:complete